MKETIEIQDRDKWLVDSHLTLQKGVIYIAVPIVMSFFLFRAISDPCWHNWSMLVGFAAASVGFAVGIALTKRNKLHSSVMVFSLSLIGFEALTMLVFEGIATTSMMGNMIVIAYSAVFSRRILYINSTIAFLSFAVSELVQYLGVYPMKIMAPGELLTFLLFLTALNLILVTVILRRTNRIQTTLIDSVRKMNDHQKNVIENAESMEMKVDDVVMHVKEASNTFASLVSEQAASTNQIDAAMAQIKRIAGETAAYASKAQGFSEGIKKRSEETARQLQSIEKSFVEVVMSNDMVRVEFSNFASKAENIENILLANREIAGQIKVLAVNAAIQAAKAGQFGVGFRVVARELKSLIQSTDDSLNDIRGLLEYIRVQAKQSTETIESTTKLLNQQMDEMSVMKDLVYEISGALIAISELIKQIAHAASQQQHSLDEVGTGITDIDTSASELRASTAFIVESVNTIAKSHKSLMELLSQNEKSFERVFNE